jgi:hypothetical protein
MDIQTKGVPDNSWKIEIENEKESFELQHENQ